MIRESALETILYLADDEVETRSLIQLIEDDTLRNQFLETFFPEEALASESESTIALQTTDYDLSRRATTAAGEERFQFAIEAVEMMMLSAEQSRTLLNIAKCHANSATVLDAETAAILAQIQQRYQ